MDRFLDHMEEYWKTYLALVVVLVLLGWAGTSDLCTRVNCDDVVQSDTPPRR